jgi:hypothetical protein
MKGEMIMKKIGTMVMAVLICLAFSVTGYAMEEKKVMEGMKAPINCATAEGDIRILESEKAHVAQQIADGVLSIVPAMAVVGFVTGKEGTRLKIATGEYNKKIDERIAKIKSECGMK